MSRGDETHEGATDWLARQAGRVIETHCARVFLAGEVAWKVKRPVDLGYLDFSTLALRGWALQRELAFNAVAAPDIYRRVLRITAGPGGFAFDGEGETVEYALEMRRFDETAVLDVRPEAVDGELAETLGRVVARFHRDAPVRPSESGPAALGFTIGSNAGHLRKFASRLGAEAVERVIAATEAAFAGLAPLLEARGAEGFARRCHGDLHLGNILLEHGRPVLFDCIEFSDRLSEIDVFYDLAFLLMDLDFRGRPDAASRVLSAYLDEAARSFPESLWKGLALLPLMQSVRAAVRCHVKAQAGDEAAARAYLAAALRHLEPARPVLAAVGGYSGSGKSTFARTLAPLAGAVVLRSDEVRKRLWGAAPLERLPPPAYANGIGEQVYGQLYREAELCLRAARSVVLDAVILKAEERARAAAVAESCGAPFEGGWLEAAPEVLRARIAARTGDASDADLSVLATQLTRDPGEVSWTRLDAEGDFAAMAQALASRIGD